MLGAFMDDDPLGVALEATSSLHLSTVLID